MKIKFIFFITILILLEACKTKNKGGDLALESKQDSIEDTICVNIIQSPPNIMVLDTFAISKFNLLILNIEGDFQIDSIKQTSGTYLALIAENFSIDSIFENIISVYPIGSQNIDEEHLHDISSKIPIDNCIVLRYSYCGDGAGDFSENYILMVSDTNIDTLLSIGYWDYYYNDLDFKRINDTIVRLDYTGRDKFGHFHDDYFVDIDLSNIKTYWHEPLVQRFNFSSIISDNINLYNSISEAAKMIAVKDSIIIESGTEIKFDSVYWKKKVFKVTVPEKGSGYVNFDDSGLEIPENTAG